MPQLSAAERAERWLPIWLVCGLFGERRSADAALRLGIILGLEKPPSRKTVMRWRTRFGWVERAEEFDRQQGIRVEEALITNAIADEVRQANLGKSLQQLAAMGIQTFNEDRLKELTGSQIARLAREGINIERLASGEATEIYAFMVSQYDIFGQQLAPLFVRATEAGYAEMLRWVNADDHETALEAAKYAAGAVWVPGFGQLMREHFRAAGVTDVQIDSA